MSEPGIEVFEPIWSLCSDNKYEEAVKLAEDTLAESQHLNTGVLSKLIKLAPLNDRFKTTLKSLFKIISKRCLFDDVVFELVDISADNDDLDIFELILNSFIILFKKVKKEMYLEWCLSLARSNVDKICEVENQISRCSEIFLNFMKECIKIHEPVSGDNKHAFIATCLHFYGSCLPNNHVEELMQCALSLMSNPIVIIPLIQYCSVNETNRKKSRSLQYYENVKKMSLTVLLHLALTKKTPHYPEIYSNKYLFVVSLDIVNELLIGNVEEQMKGLELLHLNSLRCKQELSVKELSPLIKSIFDKICCIMVYGDNIELRKLALQGFDVLIETFDIKGQYFLFLQLRNELSHSGTLAHLIAKIKNQFEKTRPVGCYYFQGKCLFDLIKLYCFIDENENVVMNAEKHIAALNFIWYLLFLEDKHGLQCPRLSEIPNTYLLPLKKLVDAAKKECQEQLEQIEVTLENNVQLSLPNLSNEEKLNSLMVSRNAIQLVELNLERVLQLCNAN